MRMKAMIYGGSGTMHKSYEYQIDASRNQPKIVYRKLTAPNKLTAQRYTAGQYVLKDVFASSVLKQFGHQRPCEIVKHLGAYLIASCRTPGLDINREYKSPGLL